MLIEKFSYISKKKKEQLKKSSFIELPFHILVSQVRKERKLPKLKLCFPFFSKKKKKKKI